MSVATWVALRYLATGRRQFARFITWVSVAGLTLGVLVLTVVISVMNGFDAELKSRILGTVPHLIVESADADQRLQMVSQPEVVTAFDFFMGAGMVTRGGGVHPVTIYGIDAEGVAGLREIETHMRFGSLGDLFGTSNGIVLGAPLAAHLGLLPGDSVALVISRPTATGIQPQINRFRLVGTFEIGAVVDYSIVVLAIRSLGDEGLDRIGVSGVRIEVADPMIAPRLATDFSVRFPQLRIHSWADHYGELFQAVRMEKLLMFLILLMVVAVAAFSIVSGQMMVVSDKRSDIAILRTMGASSATVLRIFLLQGVLISGAGIAAGLLLGVAAAHHIGALMAAVERVLGLQFLAGTYFVEVPSVVKLADLGVIGAMSATLCLASAWLPAHRASLMNPVEGLHPG